MITYTSDQQTAIAKPDQDVVMAVKINTTTPLYYCEGLEPVTFSSMTFTPHEIRVGNLRLGDPGRSTVSLKILDLDGSLAATWLSEGLSGVTATLYEAIWSEGAWQAIRTLPWTVTVVKRSPRGFIELTLSAGASIRARGGLETATRADWRYAPAPGEAAHVGLVVIKA